MGAFRDFLDEQGRTPEDRELVAAKLMGRWRSGAPLVLAPDKDDPSLGADPLRNNDFNFKEMDPHGYAVPLGSHIRRMNPRDTAANMNRRRMIRREPPMGRICRRMRTRTAGAAIAAFVIWREPDPPVRVRAKRVGQMTRTSTDWPMSGTRSSATRTARWKFKIPRRPIRKKITGLPAFTTVRGQGLFLPARPQRLTIPSDAARWPFESTLKRTSGRTWEWERPTRPVESITRTTCHGHARSTTIQHLLDLELSLGMQPGSDRTGQSLFNHDRGPPGRLAGLRGV